VSDWPLRRKIAAWSAVSTGVVLVVFSLGTIVTLYVEQVRGVDAELARDGRLILAQTAGSDPARAALALAAVSRPWLQLGIVAQNGALAERTDQFPEVLAGVAQSRRPWRTRRVDWTLWRTRVERRGAYTLVLAHSLDAKPDFVDQLIGAYFLSLPLALVFAAAAAWWLGRRALAPVSALAEAAGAITADHLTVRLPVPKAEDDLARLARVLNLMLDRLERSFHQARRFAADASHELRTPLTIMQGEVEALLRQGPLDAAQEKRLVSLLEETARLDRVTGSLLMLAQFDSGKSFLKMEAVDWSALVSEACEDAGLLGTESRLKFQIAIEPAIAVRGDAAHLRRLLINLFDNAAKFNEPEGRISCVLRATGSAAVLSIGNSGPGIPAGQVERLFERFSKTDPSAARTPRGHGLGLSLCREIARGHGGEIALAPSTNERWTEFVVTIPRLSS
jgi:two-component system heavy metal sensor histidine kinase CusS